MKKLMLFMLSLLAGFFRPMFEGGDGGGGDGGDGGGGHSGFASVADGDDGDSADPSQITFGRKTEKDINAMLGITKPKKAAPKAKESAPEDGNLRDMDGEGDDDGDSKKPKDDTKKEPETPESKEHALFKRLQEQFKDQKFETDDAKYDAILKWLDDTEASKKKLLDENDAAIKVFRDNETFFSMLQDMVDGDSFEVAVGRHIDPAVWKAVEGEPDYDARAKAKQDRADRIAAQERAKKEYADRRQITSETLKQFAQDNKYTDEQTQSYVNRLNKIFSEAADGVISRETHDIFHAYDNMDATIKKAVEEAVAKTKKEKIEAEQARVRQKREGDGIAELDGGGAIKDAPKPKDTGGWFGEKVKSEKDLFGKLGIKG